MDNRIRLRTESIKGPYRVIFKNEDKVCGTLYLHDGNMHFEGDVHESAQVFFENALKPIVDEYIREELERG